MKFKTELVKTRMSKVHPYLVKIAIDADEYVKNKYNIELTIVESATTIEEDKAVGRLEPMHREDPFARALDIRTYDVAKYILEDLKEYLLKKYGDVGAISRGSGKRNLIIDKLHGTGPHWHVQIQRGIPI